MPVERQFEHYCQRLAAQEGTPTAALKYTAYTVQNGQLITRTVTGQPGADGGMGGNGPLMADHRKRPTTAGADSPRKAKRPRPKARGRPGRRVPKAGAMGPVLLGPLEG
jgi:hypothetical protein